VESDSYYLKKTTTQQEVVRFQNFK